ncbi:hypothetical protein HY546_00295 [archaeon]|nr:hypothetical protein [archaeon]
MNQNTDNEQAGALQPSAPADGQPATALGRGQAIFRATRDLLNTLAEPDKARVGEVFDRIKSLGKALGL